MITVEHLTKMFDPADGPVLDDLMFSIRAGETLSVIGPSGCGKTTLLYILAGLSPATSGKVKIGTPCADGHKGITSFILQDFGLFPWKTVFENVALGLKIRNTKRAEIHRITNGLLSELGLFELSRRYPVQLSGGQKQRVAIARALAVSPDILLMDEPFSSLDALTREHLQNTVLTLWQKRALTYIIVTHSVEEAVVLGKYILVLSDRPTRCRAMIRNDEFGLPQIRSRSSYYEMIRRVRSAMEI